MVQITGTTASPALHFDNPPADGPKKPDVSDSGDSSKGKSTVAPEPQRGSHVFFAYARNIEQGEYALHTPRFVTKIGNVSEYHLDTNGLRILMLPNSIRPRIIANLVYRFGAGDEGKGLAGSAHALEHSLFRGTPTTPEPRKIFFERGIRANADTTYDRTAYHGIFNADDNAQDNLEWFLSWLADSMHNSTLEKADFEKEMPVIRNEFERDEDDPGEALRVRMQSSAYSAHLYAHSILGVRNEIENLSMDELRQIYEQHYYPANATLILGGDFGDMGAALKKIGAIFGQLPRATHEVASAQTLEPVQQGKLSVRVEREGGIPMIRSRYHTVAAGSDDIGAQDVLTMIMNKVPGGRLHEALVRSGDASDFYATGARTRAPGYVEFGTQFQLPIQTILDANGKEQQTIEKNDLMRQRSKIKQQLLHAVENMADATEQEVNSAKRRHKNASKAQERNITDMVLETLPRAIGGGDWRLFYREQDLVAQVSPDDVNAFRDKYLLASNRTLGTYLPTEAPQRAAPSRPTDLAAVMSDYRGELHKAETVAPAFSLTNTEIGKRVIRKDLECGIKMAVLPKPTEGDRVFVRLELDWGTLESLTGHQSDYAMLSGILFKGTRHLGAEDMAERLNELNSTLAMSADETGLWLEFACDRNNIDEVIEHMAEIVRHPACTESDFNESKRDYLAGMQEDLGQPGTLVGEAIDRHFAPHVDDNDPRAYQNSQQYMTVIENATLQATMAFYRHHANFSNGRLAIVGPVDTDGMQEIEETFMAHFGNWPLDHLPKPLLSDRPAVAAKRFILQASDKQDAVYSALQPLTIHVDDADATALSLAVEAFGARGHSRLWNRIREKGGLSYDVFAELRLPRTGKDASFKIEGTAAPENMKEFDALVKEELSRVMETGFTQKEIDDVRLQMVTNRQNDLSREDELTNMLTYNMYHDLDFEYREKADALLKTTTAEQADIAFRKYISYTDLTVAMAGDFKRLDQKLQPLI